MPNINMIQFMMYEQNLSSSSSSPPYSSIELKSTPAVVLDSELDLVPDSQWYRPTDPWLSVGPVSQSFSTCCGS